MKKIILIALILNSVAFSKDNTTSNNKFKPESIIHISSMTRRADQKFDVTCIDGQVEIRSEVEIKNNEVCLFDTENIDWTLDTDGTSGDMRFCDIQTEKTSKNNVILTISANFKKPCNDMKSFAMICKNEVCDVNINNTVYKFDFSISDDGLEVTRKSDGLIGQFKKSAD